MYPINFLTSPQKKYFFGNNSVFRRNFDLNKMFVAKWLETDGFYSGRLMPLNPTKKSVLVLFVGLEVEI